MYPLFIKTSISETVDIQILGAIFENLLQEKSRLDLKSGRLEMTELAPTTVIQSQIAVLTLTFLYSCPWFLPHKCIGNQCYGTNMAASCAVRSDVIPQKQ